MDGHRIPDDELGQMARALQEIARRVQTQGWTSIFTLLEGHPIGYGYTVGLTWSFGYPEAVVLGLGPDTTGYVLAALARKVAAGERPEPNTFVEVGLNFPVVLRAVPPEAARERLKVANLFYEAGGYETVQVVWPDVRGRFPWESGYQRAGSYQPLLFTDPPPN